MSVVLAPQTYGPDEYLALERAAPYKNEFHEGRIYAMTGASRKHNLIAVNIAGALSTEPNYRTKIPNH